MKDYFKSPQNVLALFWSMYSAWAVGYSIVKFGDKVEILTLILGLIGGTIVGGIFGYYFASSSKHVPVAPIKPGSSISSTTTETTVTETPLDSENNNS